MELRKFGEMVRANIARGWCQRATSLDAKGMRTNPFEDEAVCFCISGAWQRAWHESINENDVDGATAVSNKFWEDLSVEVGSEFQEWGPVDWNDAVGRTQADVLGLLDRVIAKYPVAA